MSDEQMIDDGFGGCWEKCAAPKCGLHVVRPGKVQCECDYDPTGKMGMLENTIATLTAENERSIAAARLTQQNIAILTAENERLREVIERFGNSTDPSAFDWNVLDQIEALTAENERLRKESILDQTNAGYAAEQVRELVDMIEEIDNLPRNHRDIVDLEILDDHISKIKALAAQLKETP